MTSRMNWNRVGSMQRQGVEDAKGKTPLVGQPEKIPRRRLSKVELREQAETAFRSWREGRSSMKYPWLVAIAILSSVGAADSADAMTYKDIA